MKLATPEQVLVSKGITSNAGSLANAAQALEQSYPVLEGILETKFEEGSVTDYFTVDDGRQGNKFRLTNALIVADTEVVRVSVTGLPLLSETDGEVVPKTDYICDTQRGVIFFIYNPPVGAFSVSVSYDHGLPVSSGDPTVLEAPQWLQSAAVSMADAYTNAHQAGTAGRKDKVGNQASISSFGAAKLSIAAAIRPRMYIQYPTHTVSHV